MGLSIKQTIAAVAREQGTDAAARVMASFPAEQVAELIGGEPWWYVARPDQFLPPPAPPFGKGPKPWRVFMKRGGRGSGKSRTGAEAVIEVAKSGLVSHLALIAKTPRDANKVMIGAKLSGILARSPADFMPVHETTKQQLRWPNGCIASIYSGENPDALRGPEHQFFWCDELMAFQYPRETWEQIDLSLRLPWADGSPARGIVTTTPRAEDLLREIEADPLTIVSRGSTYDNAENLDPATLAKFLRMYEGTRIGRQELAGEILDDVEGALWTQQMIIDAYDAHHPELTKLYVNVDPAGSSTETANEAGIVTVGGGEDGCAYVVADDSMKGTPLAWATRAVEAFRFWEADAIVAEVNFGGEMVSTIIHSIDANIPVKTVNAKRGKRLRAEPVAAQYEKHHVKHVGRFPVLESEMTRWTPSSSKSPNRLDALVYGVIAVLFDEETQRDVGFA